MQPNVNASIYGVDAVFGDAKFTLCRITVIDHNIENSQQASDKQVHSHSYYELHIITSGTAILRFEEEEVTIGCGNLLVIPPNVVHHSCVTIGMDSHEIVLGLYLSDMDEKTGYYHYFKNSLDQVNGMPLALPPQLLHRFISFYELFDSVRFRDRCLQTLTAHEIIVGLFDQINGLSDSTSEYKASRCQNEQHMMLETLVNGSFYTISEIAQSLGYSERHTARLIKQVYGKTLSAIRSERKNTK